MTDAGNDPARWFPPHRGPVVVIGNAGSVFPRHLVALWRSMGIDARIVTRRWRGERVLPDGTTIHEVSDGEPSWRSHAYARVERVAWQLESRVAAVQRRRYARAMGSETTYRPYVSPWLADALSISREVRRLRPQFVCGQEVFAYGLATSFCRGIPRILMPWGGDVYMYAETTSLAYAAVRYALTHVDAVVPGSTIARDYVEQRFGVPLDRMRCGGLWVVDRDRCRRSDPAARAAIGARFGIDPRALIVMNVRRFFPAWGADLARNSFLRFAREEPRAHFVMLGGAGSESFVGRARQTIQEHGLSNRFTLFDGDISLDDCARLMSIADIVVSLMVERDMRPLASILEAVASGGAPILGDQPEYRNMERLGFRARICPPRNEDAVIEALRAYAADAALRADTAARNARYLDEHEDGRRQAIDLLRRVRAICDTYDRRASVVNAAARSSHVPPQARE